MTAEAAPRAFNVARDHKLADDLIAIGIDSPLKLDLVVVLEQAGGAFVASDALASLCGVSQRDAVSVLDSLVRLGLVECRRFYNLTEYASDRTAETRARLADLVALDPAEVRRLRRAMLVRHPAS